MRIPAKAASSITTHLKPRTFCSLFTEGGAAMAQLCLCQLSLCRVHWNEQTSRAGSGVGVTKRNEAL